MKTILYNPIFINPLAYYVFPLLYDIEKGDSFIEPAIYSGYLIIEDLISNTSSLVINTREVDFTEFASKRIRISLYTNLGAVVLGEWLLPEGEPSGPSFHQSLVDAWFMSGPSNSDKPSSIAGVMGNEIILKNFAYALNSGFGRYLLKISDLWMANITGVKSDSTTMRFSDDYTFTGGVRIMSSVITNEQTEHIRFKVKGLKESQYIQISYYNFSSIPPKTLIFEEDFEIELPAKENFTGTIEIRPKHKDNTDEPFGGLEIELLPSAYEGALVFDGVDDYGICTGLPILDDYTIICKRDWIDRERDYAGSIASKISQLDGKNGAFAFEICIFKEEYTINYGGEYSVIFPDGISYQTATSYNGVPIKRGTYKDSNQLVLGNEGKAGGMLGYPANCAIYYFALYNKSLTPEEIETEKERLNEEWLKRTEVTIPEPDVYYDLSLKDNSSPTRNIMDDLSGNGHDAEIFNAAYALGSGYGKYDIDMSKFAFDKGVASFDIASTKVVITNISKRERLFYNQKAFASYNIRISNLKGNELNIVHFDEQGKEIKSIITEDGTYTVPENHSTVSYAWSGISATNKTILGDCNIVVELLPAAYQGSFVFDSVDDYAIMQNVEKGFKTLFMEVIPSLTKDKGGFLYDQRVGQTSFGISTSLNHTAYNAYNWGGVTYINGKLNTTMNSSEVYLKHQVITIVNGTDLKPQKVVIGGDIGLAGYFSNMALYKLIGFYDELTPLQIEKVINDYKLKYD